MLKNLAKKIVFIILAFFCIFLYNFSYADSRYPSNYPAGISINGNLWDDIQDHLQFPDYSDVPAVQTQIKWFQEHQGYLNRIITKSAPYMYYIFELTVRRNLPAELALLPIIESGFNPFGYSLVGANGLWQMMPGTASGLGLKIDWWYDGRRDIVASTNAAFDYLAYLNDFFTNDWLLAIAAYDCGEGTVQRAMRYNKEHDKPVSFWDLHLPRETTSYVPKLLALSAIIRDPDRYGIQLESIDDAPYLQQISVGSQIDLSQAAKLADVSITTIRKLNPGFRRWATDPDGPYTLLVPANKAKAFKQRLDALPKNRRVTWRKHIVEPGEALLTIAHKYRTSIDIIKQVNHIKGNLIKPHQLLLIPVAFHGSIQSPLLRQRSTITEAEIPGPQRVVHVVTNGDTLWTLSERYGVSIREIRFWNSLQPGDDLSPNQKLLIWAPPHARTVEKRFYTYKVQSGDSLSVIAHRFASTPKFVREANHLKNNIIRPGQELIIPGKAYNIRYIHRSPHKTTRLIHPYKHYLVRIVRPGDTAQKIAKMFGVSTQDVIKWNHLDKQKYLHPKQKIFIYYNSRK